MGVDWERKGGRIAVAAVDILNQRGIKTVLTVAGLKHIPKECIGKDFVNFVGYLNKNIPSQYEQMKSILRSTDFLLLPTKAECSAVVFCEAADYGTPVVTYDTGGIANYVVNGMNGFRLAEGSSPTQFTDKIEEIWQTPGMLERLSLGARKLSKEKLNWDNWTKWFTENID